MQTTREISSTAQKFLEIHDITNDLLILKDGATALIITVNAMNFGLLAEEEQDAIIYAYAGLLNSLNYPIQIVIKSQTKDVTSYLHLLDNELEVATSHTKREWIKKYRSFVANLIRERNVLDKKFYVVIPATALEMGLLPPSTVIPGIQQPDLSTVEKSVILDKAREILEPKRDHLMAQFGRIGLSARQLTTQEIISLFYLSYNPEAAEGQQITDTNSYTTPLVRASVIRGGNMMGDMTQPGAAVVAPTPVVEPAAVDQTAATHAPELAANPVAPVAPVTMPVATPMPVTAPEPAVAPASSLPPLVVPETSLAPEPAPVQPPTVSAAPADSMNLNDLQSQINSAAQEVAATPAPAVAMPAAPEPVMSEPLMPVPAVMPTATPVQPLDTTADIQPTEPAA